MWSKTIYTVHHQLFKLTEVYFPLGSGKKNAVNTDPSEGFFGIWAFVIGSLQIAVSPWLTNARQLFSVSSYHMVFCIQDDYTL